MTKFHLFSQDSVSLPSNGWEPPFSVTNGDPG